MKKNACMARDVDQYIAAFPAEVQRLLQQIRATIIKAAPEATEVLSYQIPAYRYHGILVYFAAYKTHIGFYPMTSDTALFKDELAEFNKSKGAVQFPFEQDMPLQLISRIVTFRMKENLMKEMLKARHQRITTLSYSSFR